MKQKLFLLCLLSNLFWIGCSQTFVQVLEVKSNDCKQVGSYLAYENDTIRVMYYFWEENGIMGFSVQNKTKIPIYIDWKKCSYIFRNEKNDYWRDTEELSTYTQSHSNTTTVLSKLAFKWTDETYGTSTTQITKPERITFIPPGASISRGLFSIKKSGLLYFQGKFTETRDTVATTFTKNKEVKYKISIFIPELSPLLFSSFLTYSTDEKFSEESYVNSNFYVSNIIEMPLILFKSPRTGEIVQTFEGDSWASPRTFYSKGEK